MRLFERIVEVLLGILDAVLGDLGLGDLVWGRQALGFVLTVAVAVPLATAAWMLEQRKWLRGLDESARLGSLGELNELNLEATPRISSVKRILGLEQLRSLRLGTQGGTVETTKQVTDFLWSDVESWTRHRLAYWTLKTHSGEILFGIGWGMGVPKRTMKLIDLRIASHIHQLPRCKNSLPMIIRLILGP